MKSLIVLPVLLACAAATSIQLRDGKIIGGHDADIAEYPYQLSLCIYVSSHICGASLLNENFAVTAAHCTDGRKPFDIILKAGSTIKGKGTNIFVKQIFQHPGFDLSTVDNDVSVLKFTMPVKFTDNIKPINLPTPNQNFDNKIAVCSGWGRTDNNGGTTNTLKAVELEVYSKQQCDAIYIDRLTTHMLCAGDMSGVKDACTGDSGGPLAIDNTLVGIVSWGLGCANPGHPGIYTKVTSELTFINDVLNSNK